MRDSLSSTCTFASNNFTTSIRIDEKTIDEYSSHYSTKGGMTAGFNYYRTLKEDAALVKTFYNKKLTIPNSSIKMIAVKA